MYNLKEQTRIKESKWFELENNGPQKNTNKEKLWQEHQTNRKYG